MEKSPSSLKACTADRFPSYLHPPVNEVVCGIRFQPPPKLTLPYIGILWSKFRAKYPHVQHAPTLAVGPGQILIDTITGVPLPRVLFINERDDQLVQFQTDRIYFNWRHRQDIYPRYENVIKNFEEVLDTTQVFFKESELGDFIPVECELTYLNHIPKKVGVETVEELERVFRDFSWQGSPRFLSNPVNVSWNMKFALPEKKGYLTVSLKEGTLKDDNTPVFILNLTAKGIGLETDRSGIREWFDTAREWIVCGFADLTTEKIQKEDWKRENN